MKLFAIMLLSLVSVYGEETKPTIEQLQAENKLLKAQINQLQIEKDLLLQFYTVPQLMQAKLAVASAMKEFEDSKKKVTQNEPTKTK